MRPLITPFPGWARRLRAAVCAFLVAGLALAPASVAQPSPDWTVVPAFSAQGNSAFAGVSCVDGGFCMAVGSFSRASNSGATAEIRSGAIWTPIAVPAPHDATSTTFTAVSCSSASSCTAVGTVQGPGLGRREPLAESWNGADWTIASVPEPSGADALTVVGFTGVSCTSALSCVAVGTSSPYGNPPDFTFIEAWNGTTWQLQANPPGDQSARGAASGSDLSQTLTGVSCVSASSCVAVGSSDGEPMDELWDGSSWSTGPAPPASGPPANVEPETTYLDQLNAVSCSGSPASCVAVGSRTETLDTAASGQTTGTAYAWNGSAWTALTPPSGSGGLYGVSCSAQNVCAGVGHANGPQATAVSFAAGSSAALAISTAPFAQTSLAAAACLPGGSCTFVGAVRGSVESTLALGSSEPGGIAVQPTPAPPDIGDAALTAVDCPSVGRCLAVGISGSVHPFAAESRGGHWSVDTITTPSGVGALLAVGCADATRCETTGSRVSAASDVYTGTGALFAPTLTAGLMGTVWSAQPSPSTYPERDTFTGSPDGNGVSDGAYNALTGVACPVAGRCVAVGTAQLARIDVSSCGCVLNGAYELSRTTQIIEAFTRGTWSAVTVKLPRSLRDPQLSAISCSAAAACVAVGHAGSDPLAERMRSDRWSVLATPAGAPGQLTGVACPTQATCFAVGFSPTSRSNPAGTLIERLTGSRWSVQQSASHAPAGAAHGSLNAISCTSARACTAVGSAGTEPLIEHWDGTSWSVVATPTILGLGPDTLTGVSCTSAWTCVAVGATGFGPLVEQSA